MKIKFVKSKRHPEVFFAVNAASNEKLALYGHAGTLIGLGIVSPVDGKEWSPLEMVVVWRDNCDPICVSGFSSREHVRRYIAENAAQRGSENG